MARLSSLLFFASLAACIACASAAVNPVIAEYVTSGETFTKSLHEISGSDYYFVSINGTDSLIIAAEDARVISSLDEIRSLLLAELGEKNVSVAAFMPNESERDELWGYLLAFNKSRKTEHDCEEIIGIDRFPCYDIETCWRACYTPACQTIKIGSGEFFLRHVMTMWGNKTAIDGNLTAFHDTLYALSLERPNALADFESLLADIAGIRNAAGDLEVNPIQLKEGIGFCYPITFEYGGLINASAKIAMRRDALTPLFTIDTTASSYANQTKFRQAVREGNLARPRCLRVRADAELALVAARFAVNRALYHVTSLDMGKRLNELDANYSLFNCSVSMPGEIDAFNSSFTAAAKALSGEAIDAAVDFNATADEVASAKAALAQLRAKAPDEPQVDEYADTLSALDARLKAMPAPSELPALRANAVSVREAIQARLNTVGNQDTGTIWLAIGGAIIVIIAALVILAGKFVFKKF